MSDFCHLHCHGEYSQLDGLGTGEEYAIQAKKLGQTHLAITDHGNVDGTLKFQKACAKHGIVPILGCELYICPDRSVRDNQRFHLIALARSHQGMTNLMQMLSIANLEGFYKRPRIDPPTLLAHTEGLVFMTACIGSFINMPGGEQLLLQLAQQAPAYLEVMPHAHPRQVEHNRKIMALSQRRGLPMVATVDCHYPTRRGTETQEVLLAIQRKAKWSDKDRWSMRDWPGLYLQSADEVARGFKSQNCLPKQEWINAIYRTIEVAKLCNGYTVKPVPVELPQVHGHQGRDETELMWEIIDKGWGERLANKPGGYAWDVPTYQDRINEEFDLICQQGFQRYFLIVWELISWCKLQGIMVGPGRGSSGGSLICYLMGITDVDPIRYGLIFARFISPERIDLPDIDMDFESSRRGEVVQHLRDCYGHYNVVNLSTFTTMKGKGSIQAVGRVFDVSPQECIKVSKSVKDYPDGHDRHNHALEDSLSEPQVVEFKRKYPEVVHHAQALEGQIIGCGKHAAGMAINSTDLRTGGHCSLRVYNDVVTANWDKEDAEYMGLMKFDILGIANLSFLNEAARLVRELHEAEIQFDQLPLDDQEVYREIAQGNTAGAFQIGSPLNVRYCKELQVGEFYDIVLINALTRPGPLGSGVTEQFIRRRKSLETVSYIHPRMEPYTRDTLGLVIFQEQVMWVMNQLAGLSWGECDKVRKVIGKSKGTAAFQRFRDRFIQGCLAQGTLAGSEAKHAWDMMASFGSYAFNLSHAVEYSLLGYWCMWMKIHWPMEFLCGCLSYCGEKKSDEYIEEARRLGIKIELPKQGVSLANRWLPKEGVLWAPLTAIRGVGDSQAGKILSGKTSSKQPAAKKKEHPKAVQRGFFDKTIISQPQAQPPATKASRGGAMAETLRKAGYYRDDDLTYEELRQAASCYDFNILTGQERFSRLGDTCNVPERDIVACRLDGLRVNVIEIAKYVLPPIDCQACELINECTKPVQPSFGRYNIMILGEAPGREEDGQGIGFVGSAGNDILWPELAKHGLLPEMFHTTNTCKCWPSRTRPPGTKHIAACSRWLDMEIQGLRPIMILALGSTGVRAFRGGEGKITELNGQAEWSDKWQCWISWCLHPASVLHNPGNRPEFERGIMEFARRLKAIGGAVWAADEWEPDALSCPCGGEYGKGNSLYVPCQDCPIWSNCARAKAKSDWLGLIRL